MINNRRMLLFLEFIFVSHFIYCSSGSEDQKKLLYNCFKETATNNNNCEDTRITIGENFYECETVIPLGSPPKRILVKDEEIFFSSRGNSYRINKNMTIERSRNIVPILGEVSDNKGNIYFGEAGKTLVFEKETGREIKIIVNEYNNHIQYAIDNNSNNLFILSIYPDNDLDNTGQLFTLSTDPLKIEDETIKAEIAKNVGDQITALAVQGEFLLLGIKEKNGGKLIRLKRRGFDPCSENSMNKYAIFDFIKKMQDQLFGLLDNTFQTLSKYSCMAVKDDNAVNLLIMENRDLKRELSILTATFYRLKMNTHMALKRNSNYRAFPPSALLSPLTTTQRPPPPLYNTDFSSVKPVIPLPPPKRPPPPPPPSFQYAFPITDPPSSNFQSFNQYQTPPRPHIFQYTPPPLPPKPLPATQSPNSFFPIETTVSHHPQTVPTKTPDVSKTSMKTSDELTCDDLKNIDNKFNTLSFQYSSCLKEVEALTLEINTFKKSTDETQTIFSNILSVLG